MPLLDGKYEILREEHSGSRQTLFEASAPDGTSLRIVWFEVTPEQERSFEVYRRGLRKLLKSGHAAVYDVVSRPGAHYVAWYPPTGAPVQTPDPELVTVLVAAGFTADQADIRRSGRRQQVHGLAWSGAGDAADSGGAVPPPSQGAASQRRRSNSLPQAAVTNGLAFVILLLAAVALLGSSYQRQNFAQVPVSDVAGQQINDALQALAASGLNPEPVAITSAEPVGTVVELDPAAGQSLPHGSTVVVGYAFPLDEARPLSVPDLRGLEWPGDVTAALQGNPLQAGSISWLPSDLPEGTVLAQSEPAGSTVAEGTPLNLLVSSGEPVPTTVIPDLKGLTLQEALGEALAAGLEEAQLSIVQVADITSRPGTVVSQDPPAGVAFELEAAELSLEVASGDPDMEPLESFVGLSLAEARARAGDFDITVTNVSDTSRPEGVLSQEPPAGSWVADGNLHLSVNVHPRVIPLPNPEIDIVEPAERDLAYNWYIEPGIPVVTARVYATSLQGQEQLVAQQQVQGGEWVQGTFDTSQPMVTFRLTLNGDPYGELQRAR